MPNKEKGVVETIQRILDKKNGFMSVSSLRALMSQELRNKLGIKSNDPAKILSKKLESALSENFVFRSVRKYRSGVAYYILTPCDPLEFVLSLLSREEPKSPRGLVSKLPFTYKEVSALLNELVESGRVDVQFTEKLEPQVYVTGKKKVGPVVSNDDGGKASVMFVHTREEFRRAYDELHREREFVRICDLRRALNWPREEFDAMLKSLRDSMTVHMAQAEETYFTKDELADCFVDENNYRMGTIRWNGR